MLNVQKFFVEWDRHYICSEFIILKLWLGDPLYVNSEKDCLLFGYERIYVNLK